MQSKLYYDYRDYGEMGVAEGAVMTYCRKNLTEEQGAVVEKYVSQHFDQMSKKQEALLESGEYKASAQIGFPENKYYDMWAAVSSSKTGIKPEKNTNQDKNNPDIQWFKTGWATDKGTISYIRKLFRDMDVTNEESVKNTMKQYREKLRAVYSYQSYTGAEVADYDIRTFMEQIAQRRSVLDRYISGGIDTMI